MTASGVPDCPRSARILLKDYVNVSEQYHAIWAAYRIKIRS